MVLGETATTADLDGSLDGQPQDGLNPLVPRLNTHHGANDTAVSVHDVHQAVALLRSRRFMVSRPVRRPFNALHGPRQGMCGPASPDVGRPDGGLRIGQRRLTTLRAEEVGHGPRLVLPVFGLSSQLGATLLVQPGQLVSLGVAACAHLMQLLLDCGQLLGETDLGLMEGAAAAGQVAELDAQIGAKAVVVLVVSAAPCLLVLGEAAPELFLRLVPHGAVLVG